MTDFKLDTSGTVDHVMTEGCVETGLELEWDDLSPFAQGYVEELFASWQGVDAEWSGTPCDCDPDNYWTHDRTGQRIAATADWTPLGFRDLAPETRARIIADCEAACIDPHPYDAGSRGEGGSFWSERQDGVWVAFPPLTVQLGDDGKVRFA